MATAPFYTSGRGSHQGLELPLRVVDQPDERWLAQPCLKLVLFTGGTGPVWVGGHPLLVAGPALLCLNNRESATVSPAVHCTALLFLPEILNSATTVSVLESLPSADTGLSSRLDAYWADAFRHAPNRRPPLRPLPPMALRRLSEGFARLRHELESQRCQFWPSWARAFLGEALFLTAQLLHSPSEDPTTPADFPEHPAAPVVLFLRRRYHERHTLDALAREFHTNRTTLQKRFRNYTGKSVATYLRELRLAMGRTLLSEGDTPIHEIAARIGFSDLTNFTHAFRRSYQLTPARYRRRQRPATGN